MNDEIKNYDEGGSVNYSHTEGPWLTSSPNNTQITYTGYTTVPKIDIQNVEVTPELMDELSKLVSTGNISLSLRGVTIKEYPTKVFKPKSQETYISDKEFNQVVALIKREEDAKREIDKHWKQVKGDEIGLLNDSIEIFNDDPEFTREENLLNLMEDSQIPQPIGEEVLEKIIENIDGITPETKEFLVRNELEVEEISDKPLSIFEKAQLDSLESKEEQQYKKDYNRRQRNRLNMLNEKYKNPNYK